MAALSLIGRTPAVRNHDTEERLGLLGSCERVQERLRTEPDLIVDAAEEMLRRRLPPGNDAGDGFGADPWQSSWRFLLGRTSI